jgi:hypothetical protein
MKMICIEDKTSRGEEACNVKQRREGGIATIIIQYNLFMCKT